VRPVRRASFSMRFSMDCGSRIASIGTALYKDSNPTPLVPVTSQVLSGRQDKNALDPLAEVGSKVPKVPSQEISGTSFDGSQ
jgi:hypothetical protein